MSLIALITDFGSRDWFVPSMKAVIHRINPGCRTIDISHEIDPQNIAEGAFVLWNCYSFFPAKTVFICVVDPGVGTSRKILLVQTNRYIFLAPDNGILNLVLSEERVLKSFEVTNEKYFLKNVSSTFHGRDIFSPVAAYITRGINLKEFGNPLKIEKPEPTLTEVSAKGIYSGKVIYADRFGNLITNLRIRGSAWFDLAHQPSLTTSGKCNGLVRMGALSLNVISNTYSDVETGKPVAFINSSNLLEIGIRNGNARSILKEGYGTGVELSVQR